jgi:hypothetical protein
MTDERLSLLKWYLIHVASFSFGRALLDRGLKGSDGSGSDAITREMGKLVFLGSSTT